MERESDRLKLVFFIIYKTARFFIIAIWTVLAAAFAAIASLKVIFFGEDDIAFRAIVKIFGIEFFFKHYLQRYYIYS